MKRLKHCLVLTFLLLSSIASAFAEAPELLAKANSGDVASQLTLARMYSSGQGATKDMAKAVHWYKEAGKQGSGEALYTLGTMAYNGDVLGDNVRADNLQSWIWFYLAATQGYTQAIAERDRIAAELSADDLRDARLRAGVLLIKGDHVPVNKAAGLQELEKLVREKSNSARLVLGRMYLDGKYLPQNPTRALELCSAIKLGYFYYEAMDCAARSYDALGDSRHAFEQYKLAAADYLPAMIELAQRYHTGNGTPADDVSAYAWAQIAMLGGAKQAETLKTQLETSLDDKQKKKAQKLVKRILAGELSTSPMRR